MGVGERDGVSDLDDVVLLRRDLSNQDSVDRRRLVLPRVQRQFYVRILRDFVSL